MTLAALIGGPILFTWGALVLFLVTTAITVCLGHSLGMHRRLIHRAYDCPLWLERLFVYLGTLVGMAGPYGMIRQHDIRDWAQRKPRCHRLSRAPLLVPARRLLAAALRAAARASARSSSSSGASPRIASTGSSTAPGWRSRCPGRCCSSRSAACRGWCGASRVRVAASVTGHWLVGYFAHNRGPRSWHIEGAGVQGYNVPYCGLITMGEAWHNNHHAFPGSARLGLRRRRGRSGLVGAAGAGPAGPGVERQDAGGAAAPAALEAPRDDAGETAVRLLLVTGRRLPGRAGAARLGQSRNSTLLYLAVPFGISVLLSQLTSRSERPSLGWRYLDHLRDATIVLLATSAFLYEGFVCVLMFMPIYVPRA